MSISSPAFDLQIAGVQDDGTAEGLMRSKIIAGQLVRISPLDIEYGNIVTGGGSTSLNRNAPGNADHTGSGINMSTLAGLGANYAAIQAVIYGRTVGVRFRRMGATPPFSVVVDGIPYGVPLQVRQAYFDAALGSGLGASREGVFVVPDLPDGPHSVRVILSADANAGRSLVVYGFLGESGAGYLSHAPLDSFLGGGTLTASALAVPISDSLGNPNHGVKSILYRNTAAATRTVSVTWNGVVIWSQTLAAAGSAGDCARFDLSAAGVNPGTSPNLTHQADITASINFVCVGGL